MRERAPALRRAAAEERPLFDFAPESIDCGTTGLRAHPALRRWCYPLMEGRPLESRERVRLIGPAKPRVERRSPKPRRRPTLYGDLRNRLDRLPGIILPRDSHEHRDKLNLLIRAKTEQEARGRLWTSLQLHFEFPEFAEYLSTRVRIFAVI